MGERRVMQEALCHGYSLEQHVPTEAERGDRCLCIAEHLGCRVDGHSMPGLAIREVNSHIGGRRGQDSFVI